MRRRRYLAGNKGSYDSRCDIENYLFVDGVSFSEDYISSNKSCDESVRSSFFASTDLSLYQEQGLIDCHEFGKIRSVCFCSPQYVFSSRLPIAAPKKNGHHQSMREAYFHAVNQPIPSAF